MKKEIEDIFSSSKTEAVTKCPNPNCKIIIDKREKQSLIATNLFSKSANIDFEILEIGDYQIGETMIERKTFSDFVGSMIDKRLTKQLINLKKFEKKFLILEGFYYNYEKFNIHKNAIKGMLISIANDFQIPIIYTEDESDTADFLILTAKRYEKKKTDYALRQTKNLKTLDEQKQFILEGFPGIGPTTAKKLLEEFGSLENLFKAKPIELEKFLPENKVEEFKKILRF